MDDDLISELAARRLFEPFFGTIRECILYGWSAWEAVRATLEGRRLGKSARARIVWDHITSRAEEIFDDDRSVGLARVRGLLVLDFDDALLRFKKLDVSLHTRGIETRQQQLFSNQLQLDPAQMTLWPPTAMIVAGYVLDALETRIQAICLVLLRGDRVIWSIEIPLADEAPIVLRPTGDAPAPVAPRSNRTRRREVKEAQ